MKTAELTLERKGQKPDGVLAGGRVMVTPAIDEDYWAYRVKLPGTSGQAIVGFPKFGTIGIGFAREKDWNTNLPYRCQPEEILDHIWHNAGSGNLTRDVALEAIKLVQQAAADDRDGGVWEPLR